jgi:formylglycine-generating enzyme required for sulfatase activity
LYFQRPEGAAAAAPTVASDITALPGFRADAWFLPDEDLLGFVEIPAGPFRMGSDPKVDPRAFENERWSASSDQGAVDLPVFYIGRYEVTVAQFRAFVETTAFRVDAQALGGGLDHPVRFVSWPDALAYCRWLETTLRDSPRTPQQLRRLLGDGWRLTLPTEAQWEKAARGTDGRIFPQDVTWQDRRTSGASVTSQELRSPGVPSIWPT